MIKKFYSVYDTEAQHFLNPIEAVNHSDAIRMFTTFINGDKEQSNIARYPSQFSLYYMFDMDNKNGNVGTWSNEKSEMLKKEPPKELVLGVQCIEEQNRKFTINDMLELLENRLDTAKKVHKLTDDEIDKMKVVPTNGAGKK